MINILYVIPGSGIGGGINIVLEHVSRLRRLGVNAMILNTIGSIDLTWNPITEYTVLSRFVPSHLVYLSGIELDCIVATGWQTIYEIVELGLEAKSFAYFIQANEAQFADAGSLDQELTSHTYTMPLNIMTCAHWLHRLSPSEKCFTLVNGVNNEIFYPDHPIVPKGRKLRVLIEGPIAQPRKRISDAFLSCEPHRSAIDLWCVSSGGDMPDWFRPDLFLQSIPMRTMRNVYSACDVIIKLSSAEGMFGPPLEMMACGGTAITSNCDGHEEYVRHDYNSLVANIGDINTVSRYLGLLIADQHLLARLKQGGIETASRFRWDGKIERLLEIFRDWCDGEKAMTLPLFMRRRGFHFDLNILDPYKSKSYGSLLAPSDVGVTTISLLHSLNSWFPVLRLSGWCCVNSGEKSSNGIRLASDLFDMLDDKCSIAREDIAEAFTSTGFYSGFDVVVPNVNICDFDEKSCVGLSAYITSIQDCEIIVEREIEVFLPTAINIAVSHSSRLESDNNKEAHGVIERSEWFKGLILDHGSTQLLNSRSSIRIIGYLSSGIGFLFMQPKDQTTFMSNGLQVGDLENSENRTFMCYFGPDMLESIIKFDLMLCVTPSVHITEVCVSAV